MSKPEFILQTDTPFSLDTILEYSPSSPFDVEDWSKFHELQKVMVKKDNDHITPEYPGRRVYTIFSQDLRFDIEARRRKNGTFEILDIRVGGTVSVIGHIKPGN